MAGRLTLKVVSPEKTVFSGEAASVVAPAWDGKVGIWPGHAPMISLLGAGEMTIHDGAKRQVFHVAGGLMKVESDQVTILTEYASEDPPTTDMVRALLGEEIDLDHVDESTAQLRDANPLA